jgi:hypothetical protein
MHPIFADVRKEIELAGNEARRLQEAIGLYGETAASRKAGNGTSGFSCACKRRSSEGDPG